MSPSSVCETGEADVAHLGIKLGPPAAWMPRPSVKNVKALERGTFTSSYTRAPAYPDPLSRWLIKLCQGLGLLQRVA